MVDAHGHSVIETNKVKVCIYVVDICIFINVEDIYLLYIIQRKVSVIKHRCLFSFHTQLILLAGEWHPG